MKQNLLRFFSLPRRRLAAAVAAGTLLSLLLTGCCSLARVCGQVRGSTLRLHVLAASDSREDQDNKLLVRDALVNRCAGLFDGLDSREDAEACAAAHLEELQTLAQQTLREAGCEDPVRVQLTEQYFDTRQYDTYTLPAGRYHALRVEIGSASGHNWWCVLFPPLCVAAAEADPSGDAKALWGEDGVRLVTDSPEIRFAVVEWIERLREKARVAS